MRNAILLTLFVINAALWAGETPRAVLPAQHDVGIQRSDENTSLSLPTKTTFSVNPSMERILRNHLRPDGPPIENGSVITWHHLRRLTAISIREQTLRDFTFLFGSSVRSLKAYNGRVEDFNSISLVCGLWELHLRHFGISDLSPLANLTDLTNLSLTGNDITDVSTLWNCERLLYLDLRRNRIANVPALAHLHKLVWLDLRDNPIGSDPNRSDIAAIRASSPGVRILIGKDSETDAANQLRALSRISEFALCARLQYEDGMGPSLPNVSGEVADALRYLGRKNNREYLSDVAIVLMKYVIDIWAYYRPGPIWDRAGHPLVAGFLDGVGIKTTEEGIPAIALGEWICGNREKLAPSVVLDEEIQKYHDLIAVLTRSGILGTFGDPDKVGAPRGN